ncbi:hypothetical protein [Vibrio tubiashii]|uniref:hypothetical protein n=1 Tax=Vibrio tubiashii TaxID=29498 RepID=UPI00056ED768|nr:hypothetical protein [Vibrio tubiashii]
MMFASLCPIDKGGKWLFKGRSEKKLKKIWRAGELESWRAGELESWRAGELESWRAGELESWRAGELESWRAGELESWRAGLLSLPENKCRQLILNLLSFFILFSCDKALIKV